MATSSSSSGLFPPSSESELTKTRFSNSVVIITGGSSGIGEATVKRFANDGASVIIFDINVKQGEKLAKSLSADGLLVEFMGVDVSNRELCIQAVNTVAEKHGKVNFLVNNAAYFGRKGLTAKAEDWQKSMSINVQGCSNMAQACHPHMMKAKVGQRAVVNLASISSHRAQPESPRWTYNASKGAVIILTKCMALDFANDGIRVNSVTPTWTRTAAFAQDIASRDDPPSPEKYHMLNRVCEPSEVAGAITFLCSRDASFITSIDLPVDGGYLSMSAEGRGGAP